MPPHDPKHLASRRQAVGLLGAGLAAPMLLGSGAAFAQQQNSSPPATPAAPAAAGTPQARRSRSARR